MNRSIISFNILLFDNLFNTFEKCSKNKTFNRQYTEHRKSLKDGCNKLLCKCLICGTPPPQEDHTVQHEPPPRRTRDPTEKMIRAMVKHVTWESRQYILQLCGQVWEGGEERWAWVTRVWAHSQVPGDFNQVYNFLNRETQHDSCSWHMVNFKNLILL